MLKDEIVHFTLSIIAGVIVGYIYNSFWAIPAALVSGFLIDADHLIDYCLYTKFRRFDLLEFIRAEYFTDVGKVYLFAHGYEYVIIFALTGYFLPNLSWLFYSLMLSNIFHLIFDTISNKPIWPTYFLTFRLAKRFSHKAFCFRKCPH